MSVQRKNLFKPRFQNKFASQVSGKKLEPSQANPMSRMNYFVNFRICCSSWNATAATTTTPAAATAAATTTPAAARTLMNFGLNRSTGFFRTFSKCKIIKGSKRMFKTQFLCFIFPMSTFYKEAGQKWK